MEQSMLDFGIDIAKLDAQKQEAIPILLEIYDAAQKVNNLKIAVGVDNSWSDLSTKQKAFAEGINTITSSNEKLSQSISKQTELKKVQAAEDRRNAKIQADLQNSVIGSTEYAIAKIKDLQQQKRILNVTTEAGLKKEIELNKQISDQQEFLAKQKDRASSIGSTAKATPSTQSREDYVNSIPFTHNLDDLRAEQEALTSTGVAVNELELAQLQSEHEAIAWGESQAEAAAQIGDLAVVMNESTTVRAEMAAAQEEDAKISAILSNEYKILSQAYTDLSLKAKNYALTLGEQHELTLQAAADANELGDRLKSVDGMVGQNQRKVGSYADSIKETFGKLSNGGAIVSNVVNFMVRDVLRFAASMIVFQLVFKGIELAAEALYNMYEKMKSPISEIELAQKELSATVKDGSNEYTKASAAILKLKGDIDLAKKGVIDKTIAVNEYNDTLGKAAGAVKTLDEAEDMVAQKADAYVEMMLYKAAAMQTIADGVKQIQKDMQDVLDAENDVAKYGATSGQGNNMTGQRRIIKSNSQNELDEANDKMKADSKSIVDVYEKMMSQVGDIKNKYGLKDPDDQVEMFGISKKAIDLQDELLKLALERQISFNHDLSNDENKSYDQRLNALKKLSELKIQLLNTEEKEELNQNQQTQDNVSNQLKTANTKQRGNLLIELQNAQDERQIIEAKYANKRIETSRQAADAVQKFEKDAWDKLLSAREDFSKSELQEYSKHAQEMSQSTSLDGLDRIDAYRRYFEAEQQLIINDYNYQVSSKKHTSEELLTLEEEKNNKLADLQRKAAKETSSIIVDAAKQELDDIKASDDLATSEKKKALFQQLKDKKGGLAEYKKEADKIDKQAKIDELNNQISQDKNTLLTPGLSDDDKNKTTNDQKDKQAQLNDLMTQQQLDTADASKNRWDKEVEYAQEAQDKIVSIVDNAFDQQKARIEEQKTLVEDNKNAQIDAINNSTLNQQQKTQAVALAEKNAAAQKAQLDEQEKQNDIRKARFDRAAAIAKIIENTAIAATAAAVQPWEIPAIIALGALEMAAVVSQPLPTYAEGAGVNGRPKHKGGPGIVAEAGYPEAVEEPGKAPRIYYGATLLDMAASTTVRPLKDGVDNYLLAKSMEGANVSGTVNERWLANTIVEGVGRELEVVAKAIENQKPSRTDVHVYTTWGPYIDKAVKH